MNNITSNSSGIVIDYIKYLLLNKYNFISTTNNYDSNTHSKFINYLLDLRKEKNINLFPFVNLIRFNNIRKTYIEHFNDTQYRVNYWYKNKPVMLYDLGCEIFPNYKLPHTIIPQLPNNASQQEQKECEQKRKINNEALLYRFNKLVIYTENMGGPILVGFGNVNEDTITDFEVVQTIGHTNLKSAHVVDLSKYECREHSTIDYSSSMSINKHLLIQIPNTCKSIIIFGILKKDIVNAKPDKYYTDPDKYYIDRYNIPIEEFISDTYSKTTLVHSSILEYLLGLAVCPLMDPNTIYVCKKILRKKLNQPNSSIANLFPKNDPENKLIKYIQSITQSTAYEDELKELITLYNQHNNIPFNLGYITHYNYKNVLGY